MRADGHGVGLSSRRAKPAAGTASLNANFEATLPRMLRCGEACRWNFDYVQLSRSVLNGRIFVPLLEYF